MDDFQKAGGAWDIIRAYDAGLPRPSRGRARLSDPPQPERGRVIGNLRVYSVTDIDKAKPREYLVKGLIAPAEISLWVGTPKAGKTFMLLDIAYRLSLGLPIHGRRVKCCDVLYLAAEGEAGISKRIRALRGKYGPSDRFHFIAQPTDLLHDDGDLDDLMTAVATMKAGLIAIDTLSRAIAGGDENGADMGRFVLNITRIRHETGAHVAVVHHGTQASNGLKARGHGSLLGAQDAVFEITRTEDIGLLTLAQAKDDPDGVCLSYRFTTVEIGTDGDGDSITTRIVHEVGNEVLPPSRAQVPAGCRAALELLERALIDQGEPAPASANIPAYVRVVRVEVWRDYCRRGQLTRSNEPDAKRKAFGRASRTLQERKLIGTWDDLVWCAAAPGQTADSDTP